MSGHLGTAGTARSSGPRSEESRPSTPLWGAPVGQLEAFRASMRRFVRQHRSLPVDTQATCPRCGQVVPGRFERIGEQVVLRFACPRCGPVRQVHHDTIWTARRSDVPGSARCTFTGSPVAAVSRRLPRTTETLCPECGAVILGRCFVEDRAVYMEKTCPEHGYVRDCISSDVLLYSKAAWWSFEEQPGQQRPQRRSSGCCPSDCGLCGAHQSGACLAQIDLTNRCNMRCPICFANSGLKGFVYEPPFEEIVRQLQVLRDMRPVPATAVQFTGGEPTVRADFPRILETTRAMGFSHIQLATNGLKLADPQYARRCAEAGLHVVYLQFDGVGEEAYRQTRNYPGIWDKKLAVVDNCRQTGVKICLVPTILKGVNDHRVAEIFRFAVDNIDVVSAISYQPVSFGGRIDTEERSARRYTLADLAHDIADASGADCLRDMFPLSIVLPLAQFLEALTGRPKVRPSCHPDCAFGTYFLVSPDGEAIPWPAVINIEGLFSDMNRIAARIRRRGRVRPWDKYAALRMFKRHFRREAAPPGLTLQRFIRSLYGLVDKGVGRGAGEKLTYKTLMCAGMHFQDRYNFDVERVKRCVILYSTPLGVLPFCTHNCGPEYRDFVERTYAQPQAERQEPSRGGDAGDSKEA